MPKRGENIYKRKDGRWEGRVRKPEPSETGGKYKYIYGRTYKEVKEKMEVYKKEPFRKTCLHAWNMREAVEVWLKYGKADWKPTTYRTYRQIAEKYIVPFLGNMKIDQITAYTLDHFRRQINSGNGRYLSNNYQFYICSLVRRILMYTRERYNCDISLPVLPVFQNKKGRIELPGEKTLAALENYLLENIEEDTCVGIIIALYTGIRIGELCALTWEDIDWEEGILQVKKNLQRIREADNLENRTKVIMLDPKTADSMRFIPIPPAISGLLQAQKRKTGFIISGRKNAWADPRTVQYRFKKILQKCGVEYFNFHMLRHAFATRCVAMGFDIKSLSEILGHSNVQITMSLYVHPTIQQKKKLMDRFTPYVDSAYTIIL